MTPPSLFLYNPFLIYKFVVYQNYGLITLLACYKLFSHIYKHTTGFVSSFDDYPFTIITQIHLK